MRFGVSVGPSSVSCRWRSGRGQQRQGTTAGPCVCGDRRQPGAGGQGCGWRSAGGELGGEPEEAQGLHRDGQRFWATSGAL